VIYSYLEKATEVRDLVHPQDIYFPMKMFQPTFTEPLEMGQKGWLVVYKVNYQT